MTITRARNGAGGATPEWTDDANNQEPEVVLDDREAGYLRREGYTSDKQDDEPQG